MLGMSQWTSTRFNDLLPKDQLALVLYNSLYGQTSATQKQRIDFELDEFEARYAEPSAYFYGSTPVVRGNMRSGVKSRTARSGPLSRAKRMQVARNRQRALIRAGLRSIGVSRAYYGSKTTGYVDLAATAYAANTTGSITLIATIPQGAGVNDRIGKKILLKSVQVRGQVAGDSTTTTSCATLILVYDKRPTGSLPAITDVLVSASSNSFNNDDNSGRFKIVMRRDYALAGNNNTAGQQTANTIMRVDEYVKMNKLSVFKAVGTGAIGDIEQGALYAITVGTVVAGTADANFTVGYRTRFKDIQG